MATNIFLGEPPANVKQFIIEHYNPAPAGHADTWYKYANDVNWNTVSIIGSLSGYPDDEFIGEYYSTEQIPNLYNVVELEIGTGVTSIIDGAFWNCGNLSSVIIPDTVTAIGVQVFYNCCLTSLIIPNSVQSIGKDAYSSCIELASVTIPDSVMSIGDDAFSGCIRLTSVTIVATEKPGANAEAVKEAMINAGVNSNIEWIMP